LYEHGGRWVSETLTTDRRGGTAASSVNSANKGLNLSMGYLSQNALNTFQIYSLLHALNEKRQGSVLHNPRLLVANGNNAYLQIFTITNYVRTYTQQGDIFQPEVRQYEQGVEWNVRPVISFDRKYITIRLRPRLVAYDAVNSWQWSMRRTTVIGGTTGGRILSAIDLPMTLPSIVTTQLESSVTIPDGGTVLVGGLIQDNREEGVSGVPFLSSIPVIGRALRNEKRSHEKRNLIIMVQGKIVELDS